MAAILAEDPAQIPPPSGMVAAFEPDALLDDIMAVGMKLGYVFDFGDRWVHTITVEKLI